MTVAWRRVSGSGIRREENQDRNQKATEQSGLTEAKLLRHLQRIAAYPITVKEHKPGHPASTAPRGLKARHVIARAGFDQRRVVVLENASDGGVELATPLVGQELEAAFRRERMQKNAKFSTADEC